MLEGIVVGIIVCAAACYAARRLRAKPACGCACRLQTAYECPGEAVPCKTGYMRHT